MQSGLGVNQNYSWSFSWNDLVILIYIPKQSIMNVLRIDLISFFLLRNDNIYCDWRALAAEKLKLWLQWNYLTSKNFG